jgi:hypothetical protein
LSAQPVDYQNQPACLHRYVYFAQRPYSEFASQSRSVYYPNFENVVEEFMAESNDVGQLHPRVVQALFAANQRFVDERSTSIAPDHLFQKQGKLNPAITRYFTLRRTADAREARGLGCLIDGSRGEKVPTEEEFPQLNLRLDEQGQPRRLVEVARLGISAEERGGLALIFQAMARQLASQYGSADKVPSDLNIVLWTSRPEVQQRYQDKYHFQTWAQPRADAWVMGMKASEFLTRYLP